MARITENYNDHTKEELLEECHARGVDGVNTSSLKADIVAALELSDEQKQNSGADGPEESELPPSGLPPKPVVSNIPQVTKIPEVNPIDSPHYKDEDYTGGLFKMRAQVSTHDSEGNEKRESTLYPGEAFALCVHEPDTYGRTHSLKNSIHFWEGSLGAFERFFEKA